MTDDGHHGRHTLRAVAVIAVVAVVVILVVVVATSRRRPPHPLPSPRPPAPSASPIVRSTTDLGSSVRLTVRIVAEQGWIRLSSTVIAAQPGREYRIAVRTTGGTEVTAGAWIGSNTHTLEGVTVDGTAAVPAAEVASVAVTDAAGRRYATVSFT
ncbi:hypothetical protein Aca07nite_02370 [Actinoplanes capillaceus]|uniref:Uncharacterized protein n=1 Tax=Actinoplanes campanulatus TaxID=113559 RepID=A0ABQ3WAD6_9ACTN|nr:hypothetical protein [Actinoplanes capillaceus]GID42962.1 hypothetical protein Aca07nite_02370 [Actinoplanes capillaceus]